MYISPSLFIPPLLKRDESMQRLRHPSKQQTVPGGPHDKSSTQVFLSPIGQIKFSAGLGQISLTKNNGEGQKKPNKERLRIYNLQIELHFMTSFPWKIAIE